MHGNFNRGDTMSFMAAAGPSFRKNYASEVPVSNADVGKTLARIMGLDLNGRGLLTGRVISEALPGTERRVIATIKRSAAAQAGCIRCWSNGTSVRQPICVVGFLGRTAGLPLDTQAPSQLLRQGTRP